jgi:ABC-type multidrug transport system fused ATPase/permease subunit
MGDFESIAKQFTRFFVPGLAFLLFAVALPALRLGFTVLLDKDGPLGLGGAVLISILLGYVLDAIKGYRWTVMFATYNRKRAALAGSLASLVGPVGSTNPDHYIAVLWKRDETTYNRISVERAEWVMILETSFSLLVGSVILALIEVYALITSTGVVLAMAGVCVLLLVASFLSAVNGIDRMTAHDLKLLEAMRAIVTMKQEGSPEERA